MAELVRIALAGEGGQGVQLVGEVLAEAAHRSGLESLYIPNFGVEQRGGVSIAFVQISDRPIGAPKFKKADVLVALSKRAVARTKVYIQPNTTYIFESSALEIPHVNDNAMGIQAWDTVTPEAFALMVGHETDEPAEAPSDAGLQPQHIVPIAAADIAKTDFKPRVMNIIILGAIVGASQVLAPEMVKESIVAKLGHKFEQNRAMQELNFAAFERGLELVRQRLGKGAGGA